MITITWKQLWGFSAAIILAAALAGVMGTFAHTHIDSDSSTAAVPTPTIQAATNARARAVTGTPNPSSRTAATLIAPTFDACSSQGTSEWVRVRCELEWELYYQTENHSMETELRGIDGYLDINITDNRIGSSDSSPDISFVAPPGNYTIHSRTCHVYTDACSEWRDGPALPLSDEGQWSWRSSS